MERPRITIYFWDGHVTYNCELANKIYGQRLMKINHILHVLYIYWLCEKDENGIYINSQKQK